MGSLIGSFFLAKWIKVKREESKIKKERKKIVYYEREWDKKLRGLK